MDSCHQALYDAPFGVDDLCDGGETVGCAGGIGDDVLVGLELSVVDSHYEGGGGVLSGS